MSDIEKTLQAIANGFPWHISPGETVNYVVVENPDYEPSDGSDPNLVITVKRDLARSEEP